MKYVEPTNLAEAVKILAGDDEARCLAGGATLVAMMNADLVEPSTLVGLRRIEELSGITEAGDHIRIGAMTTHSQIADDDRLTGNAAKVIAYIGPAVLIMWALTREAQAAMLRLGGRPRG